MMKLQIPDDMLVVVVGSEGKADTVLIADNAYELRKYLTSQDLISKIHYVDKEVRDEGVDNGE